MWYVRLFAICHVFAFIWAFTHVMLFLAVYLLVSGRWCWLSLQMGVLLAFSLIRFPKNQRVPNTFIPAFREAFGGAEVIRNDLTGSKKPKLYAVHPHCIAANGFGIAMNDCVLRGESVTVAASTWLCWLNPLFRWFLNSMGLGLTSVRRGNLGAVMMTKHNVAILPGGFEEVLYMRPGYDVVYIRERIGFIRFAKRFGYDIVPVFLFGESKLYHNAIPLSQWMRRMSARLRIPIVVPRGRQWWNVMPNSLSHGIRVVFGDRIPTSGDVTEIHSRYIDQMKLIHSRYSPYKDMQLLIL
jgi:hypothetical protein